MFIHLLANLLRFHRQRFGCNLNSPATQEVLCALGVIASAEEKARRSARGAKVCHLSAVWVIWNFIGFSGEKLSIRQIFVYETRK